MGSEMCIRDRNLSRPFFLNKGICIAHCIIAPIRVAWARIRPPFKEIATEVIGWLSYKLKMLTLLIKIKLEIIGEIDGRRNSFRAFNDPKLVPINPDKQTIGDITFNCSVAIL